MRPLFSVRHSPRLTNRNGRADADGAGEHRQQHGPQAEIGLVHARGPLGLEDLEPAVERLADQDDDEDDALQHQDRGVGQAHAALDQPAAGDDAAEEEGHRDDRQRVVPGEEGHQDAGVAVAGDQRGVGAAVDGRDLEHAGEPGAGAGQGAGGDHQLADRQALQHARRAALPPVIRAAKPKVVRSIRTQAAMQATTPTTSPQCTSRPGMLPQHVGLADRQGGRLVEAGRVAQRPLDQWFMIAIAI